MADEALDRQFDTLLTGAVYQTAWRYACRLSTAAGPVWRDEAEDLLQDALAQAFLKLHQLREPAHFQGWLLRIIRSRHLMRRRRAANRPSGELPPETPAPSTDLDPLAERMQAALRQLPAAQRELLELYYFEQLSISDTGLVLGIAPRAVSKRLTRARQALRRHMRLEPAPRAVMSSHPNSSKGVVR